VLLVERRLQVDRYVHYVVNWNLNLVISRLVYRSGMNWDGPSLIVIALTLLLVWVRENLRRYPDSVMIPRVDR
jgi:hypothetical protein